jgi:hypothetical protein
MTGGCNLGTWTTNSEVIHAVSPSPTGPFKLRDIALHRWHHNPQAILHPDGTWLIYTIGTDQSAGLAPGRVCKKERGEKERGAAEGVVQEGELGLIEEVDHRLIAPRRVGGPKTGEFVQLHYSKSPNGPWTFLNTSGDPHNPGIFNGNRAGDHGTNPTPWVLKNGTMVVGAHDGTGFYIESAPSWRGPYDRVPGYLFVFEGTAGSTDFVFEDPFLFFDAAAQRWRCIVHQYNRLNTHHQVSVGGAAVSLTPDLLGPWELQDHMTPMYTVRVNDTSGGSEAFARRERPKILLDAHGKPEVLYTAVCPASGLCYTHAQRFASASRNPLPTGARW